ncbi:MFS transporter [Haloferax mediterranei ATCC 33500]|uniref:MFS permease (Drug) n=3 Tax=Haloferacaceae TaxID=1644056 RepID=M0ITS0_HALMT|nr:MFS transporter [Haloferax mediterranei]AHZ23720.1 multidrug MFS transporter [Haloferax mediterranei ATCC 33500]ELZ99208.1 MFS permease (drug) [Haloferax mediterranei ATCC 33500]QCQ76214.1 MFS transporter [Haloferax mediterranei ATCC 33500]
MMTRTDGNTRLRTVALLLTSMLTVMVSTAIAPALPAIHNAFGEVPNADFLVRFVLTVPALSVIVLSPVVGVIIDRFGRTVPLFVSMVLYGLAGGASTDSRTRVTTCWTRQ